MRGQMEYFYTVFLFRPVSANLYKQTEKQYESILGNNNEEHVKNLINNSNNKNRTV